MKIAIVTGATNGMGREFVKLLSQKETFDEIWAIGRKSELLDSLEKEITTPLRKFAVDLTDGGVDKVVACLNEDTDVTWLVNAAGFGKFGRYDQIPVAESTNMIRLNCECLVDMTERVLPYMRKGARIAQFSSVAAFQPTPYQNVYAATKAFVYSYARALNVELKPRGITSTAVCPFWTESAFFSRAEFTEKPVIINKSVLYKAADVVATAYKDIVRGKDLSIHGSKARRQVRLVKICPVKFVMKTWVKQQKFDERYS